MARRFRKTMKGKMRRLFRRKRFSSRFSRNRRMKTKRARPVTGRLKLKGARGRITSRKETKFTVYRDITVRAITNWGAVPAGNVIWSNNGSDPLLNAYFTQPIQGSNEGQVDGTKYNLKYAEVQFTLHQLIPPTPIANNYTETIRVFIIKTRNPSLAINSTNIFNDQLVRNSPINSKNFDVQYDKTFQFTTGLSQVVGGITTISLWPKEKRFRFIIPMKQTMLIGLPAGSVFRDTIQIRVVGYYITGQWCFRDLGAVYYFNEK